MRKNVVLFAFIILFLGSMLYSPSNLISSDDGLGIVAEPQVQEEFVLSADGDAWLTGYRYRQDLNFFEVAGSGTDYQIKICPRGTIYW